MASCIRGSQLPFLVFYPDEESLFVNEHPASDATDGRTEAIALRVEDQVTETTRRRPGVVLVPFGDRDEAASLGCCLSDGHGLSPSRTVRTGGLCSRAKTNTKDGSGCEFGVGRIGRVIRCTGGGDAMYLGVGLKR